MATLQLIQDSVSIKASLIMQIIPSCDVQHILLSFLESTGA